ncbi:MAG: HlyD family efflux transporter periplasmic adaptor subunit [Jaaginema sp. PMC 1079.18]|nr:HlyD family efflux transporter periplasmic adaptor subunit [Jaaginema sp. PMC 1080.18]MEC4851668.1 HlyD family efflux transporter periplasmic adaptor subunit [Jaaginema sp. PMC 1079.18]MEC4868338.1 HlyD family efflux transporter periplasmic adaptor subunit [Jaaginema sp. PMC 1078.18]
MKPNGHKPNNYNKLTPSHNLAPQRGLNFRQNQTTLEAQQQDPITAFEQPVVLRQTPFWSRAIVWSIVGVVTFGVGWACIAKIEQVVPATGQLKPQGTVKEVQAPLNGVVEAVYVEEGQTVEPGDLLIRFDSDSEQAQLQGLREQREALLKENKIYRSLAQNPGSIRSAIASLDLPPEIAALTRNKEALAAEIEVYRAAMSGAGTGGDAARVRSAQREAAARERSAQLEVAQVQRQVNQSQLELAEARAKLANEQEILGRLQKLAEDGAIAQLQYLEQRQTVVTEQARVSQIEQEIERLRLQMNQGESEVITTTATVENDLRDAMSVNTKRIAEIDSQISQAVLDVVVRNEKQIAELDSKISTTEQTLKYQEVRATVGGTVFDLQASNGFVANPTEPLLSIVPSDDLVAEVFITNKDIGFVQEGMKSDIRIDTFPFSEFGDIKGEIVSIGSDALPPDEQYSFYRFPAKVRLDDQLLEAGDREIPLQSGMAVSVNIKVRENRRAIDLFLELFTDQIESLKEVR